jgi:hypothetical protein
MYLHFYKRAKLAFRAHFKNLIVKAVCVIQDAYFWQVCCLKKIIGALKLTGKDHAETEFISKTDSEAISTADSIDEAAAGAYGNT